MGSLIVYGQLSAEEVGYEEDSISYCCDASKFKRDYGWKPMTSLSKGIMKSLKYFGR